MLGASLFYPGSSVRGSRTIIWSTSCFFCFWFVFSFSCSTENVRRKSAEISSACWASFFANQKYNIQFVKIDLIALRLQQMPISLARKQYLFRNKRLLLALTFFLLGLIIALAATLRACDDLYTPADVVLLVDGSGSLSNEQWGQEMEGGFQFVKVLRSAVSLWPPPVSRRLLPRAWQGF